MPGRTKGAYRLSSDPASSARRSGYQRYTVLALCGLMALVSIGTMRRGMQQTEAFEGNAYDAVGYSVRSRTSGGVGALTVQSASAQVADALFLARGAASMDSDPARVALLARAIAMVGPVRTDKPYWGEASAILAYAYSLKDPNDLRFPAMLTLSYAESPYLRSSAFWRVQAGLSQWERLDQVTRDRVIDEAVWFTRVNQGATEILLPLFRVTPAYRAFVIRRLEQRVGDRDFASVKGMAQ